jgi:DnaJ-class molecular chaperone
MAYWMRDEPCIDFETWSWEVSCFCCGGTGEHEHSPSGYTVDPDGTTSTCDPCEGYGEFVVSNYTDPKNGPIWEVTINRIVEVKNG